MPKQVTAEPRRVKWVSLDAVGVATTTGYILVDLSDNSGFPHTEVGSLFLEALHVSIRPDATFAGDVELGFLSNVGAASGDFHKLFQWHLTAGGPDIHEAPLLGGVSVQCAIGQALCATDASDTTWQTDVTLDNPTGVAVAPGSGDLALKITRTAGTLDFGIGVGYSTKD